MIDSLSIEDINTLIEQQLAFWPDAARNFKRLNEVKRKRISLGHLDASVQFNPARIVSTGAKIDKDSISKRPCFLCKSSRCDMQMSIPFLNVWELLINPFPILPVHFTIADLNHQPQGSIPLDMASMAEKAPNLTFFYNGAHAGASAPDHRHAQAVLTDELPLMRLAETLLPSSESDIVFSDEQSLDLPFHFVSAVIRPDEKGIKILSTISTSFGIDSDTCSVDRGLVNSFFWIDNNGILRIVVVPRRKHRPSHYYLDDNIMVSPGAIDMAGIMITPRENDFNKMDETIMREIYKEVAFAKSLPSEIKHHFAL